MLLSKALGQGGSASDALKGALFNTLAAASFNLVGDYTKDVLADGSLPKIAVHAMVGGLLAKATGGDFRTGALAAGANEAVVVYLDDLVRGNKDLLSMSSQIVGVLAAAGQADADAAKMEKGGWVAKNATQYNWLLHHETEEMLREIDEQKTEEDKNKVRERYAELDETRNRELPELCRNSPNFCDRLSQKLMQDDPKLLALAKTLSASGKYDEAAVIGLVITNSNLAAGSIIATELAALDEGESTRFKNALGGAALGAVLGGSNPGRGAAKGILTPKDFPEVSTKISQRQNRHTAGTQQQIGRAHV